MLTEKSLSWPNVCAITGALEDAYGQMKCAVIALDVFAGEDEQARILIRDLNDAIGKAHSALRNAGVL